MPLLVFSQPLNTAAFVLDGVVFGAGAFAMSCRLVAVAATPALACMGVAATLEVRRRGCILQAGGGSTPGRTPD